MTIKLACTLLLFFTSALHATDKVGIKLITTPIYHLWENADVRFVSIPKIGWDLDLEQCAYFYSTPYGKIEGRDVDPIAKDVNLISVYGLRVTVDYLKEEKKYIFVIDRSLAKKPKGFKFTIEEVTQMAIKAIKADFPDLDCIVAKTLEKQRIQKAEQGGADQPATALETKPQGKEKPKPESERRPQ